MKITVDMIDKQGLIVTEYVLDAEKIFIHYAEDNVWSLKELLDDVESRMQALEELAGV